MTTQRKKEEEKNTREERVCDDSDGPFGKIKKAGRKISQQYSKSKQL